LQLIPQRPDLGGESPDQTRMIGTASHHVLAVIENGMNLPARA
jgi:hypothetical protein